MKNPPQSNGHRWMNYVIRWNLVDKYEVQMQIPRTRTLSGKKNNTETHIEKRWIWEWKNGHWQSNGTVYSWMSQAMI